jgi:transposase
MAVKRIADIIGVSKTSIYNWIKLYKTQGKMLSIQSPKDPTVQRDSQKRS